MLGFGWLLLAAGSLTLPAISLAYLYLRLPGRRTQLVSLFTMDQILPRYLAMRGRQPKRVPNETEAAYHRRLRAEFDRFFSRELAQEYSIGRYLVPMLLAWGATAMVLGFLVAEAFGASLRPGTPSPILHALLGALFWSLWSVIRGYTRTDLVPATFLWIVFRYLLAAAYGLLAAGLFTATVADLGAFVMATLPFSEGLRFVRSRLAGQVKGWAPAEGYPRLGELQGLDPSTIEKLGELGIFTTQELAFSDPLDLLLRSNFSPKVLIDWMDQAFLFNYIGEKIALLRPRGIRGAIELASLQDIPGATALLHTLAQVLSIGDEEIVHLCRNLYMDNQVQLIWQLWGAYEPSLDEPVVETPPAAETPKGDGMEEWLGAAEPHAVQDLAEAERDGAAEEEIGERGKVPPPRRGGRGGDVAGP